MSDALHWISAHSGVPVIVVAAVILVLSWKFLKWSWKFLVQIAIVAGLLFLATKLGWISF
jgi:hypothetical protein